MREIKFRIWHKNEERWLDPWAEEDPILSLQDFGKGCEVYLYDRKTKEHSNINCQMDDVVIQQYTGLKDKNGKEIYEGDIFKDSEWWVGKATVEHVDGMFGFQDEDRFVPLIECKERKVIGNTFEGVGK